MILYINGCSHTAAAEAAVPHAFAEDDWNYQHLGRRPHPDNFRHSWATQVSQKLNLPLECDAESAASNDRIIRTTRDWINTNTDKLADTVMIIQWTTWEREEWLHDGTWYQVNASGIDSVPPALQHQYREFVASVDWAVKTRQAHEKIWQLHLDLKALGVRHVFFNGQSTFSELSLHEQQDWAVNYIEPYSIDHSYAAILRKNGYDFANPNTYHFGVEAHCFWANYVLQYLDTHNILDKACATS